MCFQCLLSCVSSIFYRLSLCSSVAVLWPFIFSFLIICDREKERERVALSSQSQSQSEEIEIIHSLLVCMSVCQLWTLLTLYLLSAARPLSSATMQCNGCVVCVCALFLSVISALSLTSTLSLCSFLLCSLRCSVSLTLRLHLCLLPIHCSLSAPCPRCSSNTAVL